jgi:predicted nucleic acid-binding protein
VPARVERAEPRRAGPPGATLLDSSCLVALACAWHEHYEATRIDLERRERHGERILLACHALVEAYAVLTRLPPPHRRSPDEALALLRGSWEDHESVSLSSREHWEFLDSVQAASVSGGRTYDALIAACARKAKAFTLLTWNLSHFEGLGGNGLEIVSPES